MSTKNGTSPGLKRNDYKAIKHMNREQMDEYLRRIYKRGYEAGLKASTPEAASGKPESENGG